MLKIIIVIVPGAFARLNLERLTTMSKSKITDATLAPYAAALNHWPKASGEQPTAELFATIQAMNIRPGKHVLACAMYLRPEGATDDEVKKAAGKLDVKGGNQGVLHNYRRDLEKAGYVRRDMNVPNRDGGKVFKILLTKKGEAQVARYTNAVAKKVEAKAAPKKAKGKKARKAKAAPVADTEAAQVQALVTAFEGGTPEGFAPVSE